MNINEIKPDKEQPRKTFDEEKLQFLAESILSNGLLKPIEVDDDGMIIDGERRFRACNIANLKEVDVIVIKNHKDKKKRLRRQLVADIQDEDIPTDERYEAIVQYHKLCGTDKTQTSIAKELGIPQSMVSDAVEHIEFSSKEPELAKEVSPYIIRETRTLPEDERLEIIEEFKGTKDKKKDLIRELVKGKKEEIKTKKNLEVLKKRNEEIKEAKKWEIKVTTTQDVLNDIRDGIYRTHNELNSLMSRVRRIRRTKFYLYKPKEKENFITFLDGASERARKWAKELDDLKENISLEIVKE